MAESSRRRITFDADPDVSSVVSAKGKGERGAYLNEAVRRFEHPPYRLGIPVTPEEDSIEPILQAANREIVMVGTNLGGASRRFATLLRKKVSDNVRMTFITINPAIGEGDPLFEVLANQLGDRGLVEAFRLQAEISAKFFRQLRTLGRETGVKVRVLGCNEVPMYGLVASDPDADSSRMRVNFYRTLDLRGADPFLDIDQSTREGRLAYRLFYRYYENLVPRADDIPDH